MWAPWRIQYILGKKERGCIFCKKIKEHEDEKNLILYRGKNNFVIMNAYPYNNGHLMVVPYRHVKNLEQLNEEELFEYSQIMVKSVKILKNVFSPDGFNIGMNLGNAAGAGIRSHLHMHIVPRWKDDTNFMPVIGDVKVLPEALTSTYKKLKKFF